MEFEPLVQLILTNSMTKETLSTGDSPILEPFVSFTELLNSYMYPGYLDPCLFPSHE